MKLHPATVTVLGIGALGVLGCGSHISVPALRPEEAAHIQETANFPHAIYRLEPGDKIQIRYTFHPEMDEEEIIRPDGKIRAKELGDILAAGKTTAELAELLRAKSSNRLREPEVIVSVLEYAPKTIYVAGEVGSPGPIPYQKGLTPMQAVIRAGGFLDTALQDQVVLVRPVGAEGKTMSRTLDVQQSLRKGEPEKIHLAPRDVLYVPRTGIAEADIWVDQHVTQLFPFFKGAGGKIGVGGQ